MRLRLLALACLSCLLPGLLLAAGPALALSRVKDLASVEGMRTNQLIGYGIVVGLNGTGDTLNNAPFTKQSVQAMLERLGVNTRGATMRTANLAAVMVTANLPPFAAQGTRIDVTVSSLGDAKSLQGGTLLVTPLLAADGEAYAVAQGSLAIAGFQAEGDAAKITRGVPTNGRIANGAVIEREIAFKLNEQKCLRLSLRNPDFTTSKRIAAAINDFMGADTAEPTDPSTVTLQVPPRYQGNMIRLLTEVEQLKVEPDQTARVVIDERSGIIVMGPRRAGLHRGGGAGQPHRHHHRAAAGEPAGPVLQRRDRGGAAHRPQGRCRREEQARPGQGGRDPARTRRRAQRARHRPARPDLDPPGDQGLRRAPGRHRGDVSLRPSSPVPALPSRHEV